MRKEIVALLIACGLSGGGADPLHAQRPSPLYYDDPVFGWQDNRDPETPRVSPNGLVGLQLGSTRVMVAYGRPAGRGRTIFGSLVSFGNVWRTGADEATTITLSGPLEVEGRTLEAGTYALFTIPGVDEWTFIFSRDSNQWGSFGYSDADDVLRATVSAEDAPHRERLTFTFEEVTDTGGAALVLHWEETRVALRLSEP